MKICRYALGGAIYWGVVQGEVVVQLAAPPLTPTGPRTPELTSTKHALDTVTLLAPCMPSKVVGVGLNYREHALEMGEDLPKAPLLFLKPPTTVIGPGDPILWPAASQRVDYEAELAVVIARPTKDIQPEVADDYIFGYTCANDVTARDLQKSDGQWTRGKGFDSFSPIGPWIETEFKPSDQRICSRVAGEIRQDSSLAQLIFSPQRLVAFVSGIMTLMPGDIIITGTPSGVGPLRLGAEVEIEVGGIGVLRNPVKQR